MTKKTGIINIPSLIESVILINNPTASGPITEHILPKNE